MNKIIEQKKLEIEKLKKEVADLALIDLERAKKDGRPFEEIFELWINDDIPKENIGWIVHVDIEGAGDIWNYIDYGEPDRRRTYTTRQIIEQLENYHLDCDPDEKMYLTKKQLQGVKQQFMVQNIGSIDFDW